jgi:hypothetical protein
MSLQGRAYPLGVSFIANLVLFALMGGGPVLAMDFGAPADMRVAAVSTDSISPNERDQRLSVDGIWLLAQNAAVAAGQGEGVLALFDTSTSEGIEDEVAKAHGLELVSRLALPSLDKRMVRFRIPDGRSVEDVITVLRADQRVASVQPNFRYRRPHQPTREITRLEQPAEVKTRQARGSGVRRVDGKTTIKMPTLRGAGSLVAGNQRSMRWPSADEPFVNVGR